MNLNTEKDATTSLLMYMLIPIGIILLGVFTKMYYGQTNKEVKDFL
jgi:hypothetical protein